MSHRYKKSAPSTHMHRHFAVVTVVATGLLAIFADGHNAEALAQKVEEQKVQHEVKAEAPKKVVTPPQQPGGVWGSSTRQDFVSNSAGSIFARSGLMASDRSLRSAGYGSDYLSQFKPDERTGLAQAAADNIAGVESQQASIEAASRARSGSAGRE
ncbi:hypothetical protein GRI89_04110 [Altererythrobacter salegens]|uniref:Uncharacterized protein n=1 Tax=Croceibacterium salegens TaxID=1737568 RepID=A0A6I4SS27_9SPHN|nr:hypothetical protein [Croceibacterium salegens]MXO58724.1 hypothetical protein [Croceibacterium salegens]